MQAARVARAGARVTTVVCRAAAKMVVKQPLTISLDCSVAKLDVRDNQQSALQ
jgi:hypothetical protein